MSISPTSTAVPTDTGVYVSAPLGGGHVTAKNGVKARQEEECQAVGHRFQAAADIDITKYANIGPFRFGDWSAKMWNDAQKKGDLRTLRQMTLPICMRIAEFFMGWIVRIRFKAMLRSLQQQPKYVVSTQAFCLKDMARAIYEVNKEKGWDMRLDVYLTDLPSKRATHFFPSVKRLADDPKLRAITTLHASRPIEKPTRTEQEFWEKHCGKITVKTDDPFPIRATFLHTEALGEKLRQPTVDIPLRLNTAHEIAIIQSGIGTLDRGINVTPNKLTIQIREQDKVGFLMLGSQPTQEAVLSWLKMFIQARGQKATVSGRDHYFFLYCGAPEKEGSPNPLWNAVAQEIAKMKQEGSLPSDMHIVPFTNQDADVIAPLMARSDMTVTRSGGATSMELLQLHQSPHIPRRENRCTFIHSEALTRPHDAHVLMNLRKRLDSFMQSVQERDAPSRTEGDWEHLHHEMMYACRLMGIPGSQRSSLVTDMLAEEKASSKPLSQRISSLMISLEQTASELSREAVSRERKIQQKMEVLKQKDKYSRLPEEELRRAAIEKLLIEEGIILWEGKNARYLQANIEGTHIVNPEYAEPYIAKKFFQG